LKSRIVTFSVGAAPPSANGSLPPPLAFELPVFGDSRPPVPAEMLEFAAALLLLLLPPLLTGEAECSDATHP
jgi:hypothetical protein